jgi:hypothetical protein
LPGEPPSGNAVALARVRRRLTRAGCGSDAFRLLLERLPPEPGANAFPLGALERIATFATTIGERAARDYFHAIGATGKVAELTAEPVLAFARSIDRHSAEWYFWAIGGTGAVSELTSPSVLAAVDVFRSLDSAATVEYFLAVRETKAVRLLTEPAVLELARDLGSDAATELFGACWETRDVAGLTGRRILDFARALGKEAAREYFRAVRETRDAVRLTAPHVLETALAFGGTLAADFFRAVRETGEVARLTADRVLAFAEALGRSCARAYFVALRSTGAVARLTAPGVLQASGVVRSIGEDAALDYFLAAARSGPSETSHGAATPGASPSEVPVLTLLDLPSYDRFRPVGLLGVSVVFWWYVWQSAALAVGAFRTPADVALALAGWTGALVGAYLLMGAMARRSSDQFLARRRQLLNEHGIRWHDCLHGSRGCEQCWRAGRVHEDARFDYGAFCRCPAC